MTIRGCNRLQGLLTSASLVWTATPLTTAKFFATTSIDETTVPGVSGVLTHTYTVEVDHDFRRWLTAIGKFTWGTLAIPGRRPLRPDLLAVRRPDLQAEPQHLAQGHAAPRLAGSNFPAQHGVDGGDAREVADRLLARQLVMPRRRGSVRRGFSNFTDVLIDHRFRGMTSCE